jgi:hypothetical protein
MPEFYIQAFRARTMIMGRFGPHSAISAHDPDTARCEDASLKFLTGIAIDGGGGTRAPNGRRGRLGAGNPGPDRGNARNLRKHPRLGLFHDPGQKWPNAVPNWPRSWSSPEMSQCEVKA